MRIITHNPYKLKVCANCRYLNLLDKGYEFQSILDSEYLVFQCSLREWTVREDYLMKPRDEEFSSEDISHTACPFWEEWLEDQDSSENVQF